MTLYNPMLLVSHIQGKISFYTFNPIIPCFCSQVSDIPGVVHMVEYHDMGDSIWIVLERGDHTKVSQSTLGFEPELHIIGSFILDPYSVRI